MPDWSNETRTCDCGVRFTPKREDQHYCGTLCRDRAAKRRRRSMDKSGDSKLDLSVVPRNMDTPASDSSSASEWDNWPVCPVCKLWQNVADERATASPVLHRVEEGYAQPP